MEEKILPTVLKCIPTSAKKCVPTVLKCIPEPVKKCVPYIAPVIHTVGAVKDTQKIIADATFFEGVKIISLRFASACTPPKLFLDGTCIMLFGGSVATIASGGNPIIALGALAALRAIIQSTIKVVK